MNFCPTIAVCQDIPSDVSYNIALAVKM